MMVRILMKFEEDPMQNIIIVSSIDKNNHIPKNTEFFGSVYDWNEDRKDYVRYPFYSDPKGRAENNAVMNWQPEESPSYIELYNRRIVSGEKIIRTDYENGKGITSVYTIMNITELP